MPDEHWHPLLAWAADDDAPVGYAGLMLPPGLTEATGDVVLAAGAPTPVVTLLLDAARNLAADHQAVRLAIWMRRVEDEVLQAALAAGWRERRRLHVLGCGLDHTDPRPLPPDVQVVPYDTSRDDAIVDLLQRAYDGTPDGGWDEDRLAEKRALPWFDPADVLLAVRDGHLLGLHWTKRRDAVTGEVYNLAVAPEARGLGLGAALLDLGLAHLREQGCRSALLWVDRDNAPALALYESRGFGHRWSDVALDCTVC